jgi:hypothetical protein
MNRRTGSLVAAVLILATVPAAAQWLNYPTPGIPRLPDGKPDLSAPAPRKPDGKPDLSGIWQGVPSPDGRSKYLLDLAADFKPGELPIQPWAEALTKERRTGVLHAREWPDANCLPPGIPVLHEFLAPFKIIQEPELAVILYERQVFRQILMDGRTLPKDPNPTWMGYSVGKWEGDALVVDSIGFNGKIWIDFAGHPSTDALHIIERYRRRDFGHLDIELTIDDPKAYTKPWSVKLPMTFDADDELVEFVCNENEKDLKHLPAK